MSQNLVSLALTDAEFQAVEQALTTLETTLAGLVSLTPAQRVSLTKMGQKSEMFCRQTLGVIAMNPSLFPPSMGMEAGLNDLRVLDRMRPFFRRLTRLTERSGDTEFALGSDVMHTALQGYAQLKLTGKNQGLEGLRKWLSARFTRAAAANDAEPEADVA